MTLEEFKRKYGHEIGGIWVPRVTAITEIVAKPALLKYYAAQESFEAAQIQLRHSANWGSLTHKTIEELLKGNKPQIDPKILPSIEAFLRWKGEHEVRILDPEKDIERMIFDPDYLYAGRMDALIEIDGELGILDIKTSTGIWEEYYLQTAAYLNAYNKMALPEEKAQKRWILRVEQYEECMYCGAKRRRKSGKEIIKGGNPYCQHKFGQEIGIFEFKELEKFKHDLQAFLSAKELWEWYHKDFLKQIRNYPKQFNF
jgi:hypothetical protein